MKQTKKLTRHHRELLRTNKKITDFEDIRFWKETPNEYIFINHSTGENIVVMK